MWGGGGDRGPHLRGAGHQLQQRGVHHRGDHYGQRQHRVQGAQCHLRPSEAPEAQVRPRDNKQIVIFFRVSLNSLSSLSLSAFSQAYSSSDRRSLKFVVLLGGAMCPPSLTPSSWCVAAALS